MVSRPTTWVTVNEEVAFDSFTAQPAPWTEGEKLEGWLNAVAPPRRFWMETGSPAVDLGCLVALSDDERRYLVVGVRAGAVLLEELR